ncbi:MAG: transglutaminase domain-containing protein [Calditrichaeota bacterium]|jgi:transglutaminase-like putative cysteine protease|nr:transglutaminase domain-containing protein [Calditrichota bacterium]MBT7615654.1 transglutaminase domain-containing protein [Calditrichota bacterium]MBT7787402.1 transglutaminase domain-containing protein [Calditrichota bacterium]
MFDTERLNIRLSWWGAYIAWFALIAVLITGYYREPHGGLHAPEELLWGVFLEAESNWMGIYLSGQKIGYVNTELEPLDTHGYEIREFSSIQGAMMGVKQQMRMSTRIETDSTLALVSFRGRLEAEPYATVFSGWVEDKVLRIEVNSGGKSSEKFFPAPEPIYLSQAIKPLLHAGRLGANDSLKLAGFDPVKLEMQDLSVFGAPIETHRLWGNDYEARKLTTRMAGMESSVYVDAEGNSIAEFAPLGMTMRREEKDVALAVEDDDTRVDFLAIYSIKPDGVIKAPRRTKYAKYRIFGVDAVKLESVSGRQRVVDASKGILEVFQEGVDSTGELRNRSRYVSDAPFIESRERSIIEVARNVMMGGVSRIDSLNKLTDWVFHAIKKQPATGIPSALAVLQQLQGDCNEHSVLFTALARSVGIPARIQLGVVYQQGRFYYHAWSAAWVDGCWEEFDPTFGQEQADAARIAFASGGITESTELAPLIGNVEIEIIETEIR